MNWLKDIVDNGGAVRADNKPAAKSYEQVLSEEQAILQRQEDIAHQRRLNQRGQELQGPVQISTPAGNYTNTYMMGDLERLKSEVNNDGTPAQAFTVGTNVNVPINKYMSARAGGNHSLDSQGQYEYNVGGTADYAGLYADASQNVVGTGKEGQLSKELLLRLGYENDGKNLEVSRSRRDVKGNAPYNTDTVKGQYPIGNSGVSAIAGLYRSDDVANTHGGNIGARYDNNGWFAEAAAKRDSYINNGDTRYNLSIGKRF
jgi:hypothetical protein